MHEAFSRFELLTHCIGLSNCSLWLAQLPRQFCTAQMRIVNVPSCNGQTAPTSEPSAGSPVMALSSSFISVPNCLIPISTSSNELWSKVHVQWFSNANHQIQKSMNLALNTLCCQWTQSNYIDNLATTIGNYTKAEEGTLERKRREPHFLEPKSLCECQQQEVTHGF
jgi:hypothetical protein